jgi:hypothetical protein
MGVAVCGTVLLLLVTLLCAAVAVDTSVSIARRLLLCIHCTGSTVQVVAVAHWFLLLFAAPLVCCLVKHLMQCFVPVLSSAWFQKNYYDALHDCMESAPVNTC